MATACSAAPERRLCAKPQLDLIGAPQVYALERHAHESNPCPASQPEAQPSAMAAHPVALLRRQAIKAKRPVQADALCAQRQPILASDETPATGPRAFPFRCRCGE